MTEIHGYSSPQKYMKFFPQAKESAWQCPDCQKVYWLPELSGPVFNDPERMF